MKFSKVVPKWLYDYDLHHAEKGKKFDYSGVHTKAKVVGVYDGDTITIVFRYRGELQQHNCRMMGYDSPELRPSKKMPNREQEIEAAKRARDKLREMVGYDEFYSSTKLVDVKLDKFDKYGRPLVQVYCNGINVNEWMIVNGYGYPYNGGTKRVS